MINAEQKARERMLVVRLQWGDRQAFVELFERYHGPLKYYLRRLLDSPETADDVLQDVWVKVLRGVKRLRSPDAFKVWVYRIARNEAFQRHRRRDDWRPLEVEPGTEPEGQDSFGEEDAERVHAALAQLSPPHREVLVLRFLEGLTYDEIGSVIGCELGTVRSRIHYAKRGLRRILEDQKNDGRL